MTKKLLAGIIAFFTVAFVSLILFSARKGHIYPASTSGPSTENVKRGDTQEKELAVQDNQQNATHPHRNRVLGHHNPCQLAPFENSAGLDSCPIKIPYRCHGKTTYETDSKGKNQIVCPNYDSKSERCGPSIFIIGAQKAGTTSTFQFIKKHPDFQDGLRKEMKFYSCNTVDDAELRKVQYLSLFPSCKYCVTGEATPEYSMKLHVAKAMKKDWPDARILFLIRDPVERAESHYRMVLKKNKTDENPKLRSFAHHIQNNMKIAKRHNIFDEKEGILHMAKLDKHTHFSLLERGMYASMIEQWTSIFHKNQFMVVLYEELIDPTKQGCILREILKFFGLRHNHLSKALFRFPSANVGMKKKSDDPETMSFLREFYKPFNRRLKEVLQRDIPYDV